MSNNDEKTDILLSINPKAETLIKEIKGLTDLEKFIELYKSFGVELESKIVTPENKEDGEVDDVVIDTRDNFSDKLVGYSGFYSIVVFDPQGKFLRQGFWE